MRDPPPHPDLKIGQSVLAFVSTAKVLGVWLQNDLMGHPSELHEQKCSQMPFYASLSQTFWFY